jgi:hypothetical protein
MALAPSTASHNPFAKSAQKQRDARLQRGAGFVGHAGTGALFVPFGPRSAGLHARRHCGHACPTR